MVRIARAFALLALAAASAQGHLIVDMKLSVRAPAFVAAGQQFTYEVVADDLANDTALGLVVADTLPAGVTLVGTTAPGWRCDVSKGVVSCSAEQFGPGEHVISIRVTAPSQPGAIVNKAHITSLGSTDPTPANDDATNSVMIYAPSHCTAPAPLLVSPAEGAVVNQPAQFAWTAVAGATFVVRATTEGAAATELARTTATAAAAPIDRGATTWWVEATFSDCPPAESAHQHFTAASAPRYQRTDVQTGLAAPSGLAFGPGGELYIADEQDSVVRMLNHGQLTTVAGAPGQPGSTSGQFARFNHPTGIAVTPIDGFIYLADTANNKVRVLYTGGPFVPGFDIDTPAFSAPSAIAATFRGSLYVADTGNNVVRLMTPVPATTGIFTTTTAGSYNAPSGVAVDASGALYVAEQSTGTIRKDGAALASGFVRPGAIALDTLGNLYVCDRGAHQLLKVAPSGLVTAIASFGDPAGVAVAADGSVYVADAANHSVRRVDVVASEAPPAPAASRRRAAGH